MPLRNLFVLIACLLAGVAAWAARHRDLPGSRFNEVLSIISRSALEPVAARQLFEAAVAGAVGQLDEHSAYIPRAEQDGFEALLDQQFGGIGLELVQDEATGELIVSSPVVSGPGLPMDFDHRTLPLERRSRVSDTSLLEMSGRRVMT